MSKNYFNNDYNQNRNVPFNQQNQNSHSKNNYMNMYPQE